MRLMPLWKETWDSSFHYGIIQQRSLQPGRGFSSQLKHAGALILDLTAPRTVRNKFLLFISYSVSGSSNTLNTALFTIAKIWKQPKWLLISEWINMLYIYRMEYHSAIKNKTLPFTTWMDLEDIMLSDMSAREGQMLYDHQWKKAKD